MKYNILSILKYSIIFGIIGFALNYIIIFVLNHFANTDFKQLTIIHFPIWVLGGAIYLVISQKILGKFGPDGKIL